MARVVTRRSGTPYLLVVFVFLFVIAAALAVLGFMQRDEAVQESAAKDTQITELKSDLAEATQSNQDLVQLITGRTGTPTSAKELAEQAYAKLDERPGLAPEVLTLLQKINELQADTAERQKASQQLTEDLQAKQQAIADLQQKHDEVVAQLNTDKESLTEELTNEKTKREEALREVQADLEALRQKFQNDIVAKEQQIEKLLVERQSQERRLSQLMKQLRDLKEKLNPREATVANAPDGKIEKIASNSDVCYINIGSKDRVQPGMTFAVYGQNPTNAEDVKGRVLVSNVSDNFSECRIIEQDTANPIVVGDEVANLAFHAVRTYVFTVFGEFDLHGTNNPTRYGTQEVKEAIQRFGGKVGDTIDIQTDYVVMGDEPPRPEQPAPDASPSVQKAYQLQLREYNDYRKAIELAESLKIPVLNTNRFLLLTGYEPSES